MTPRLMDLMRRLAIRIEQESTPDAPSIIMPPPPVGIDDGLTYADPLADNRPEFVKAALKGWRSTGRGR